MGRRSINTTKSGKYMNPTDQARKEARKKELKKNKRQRQMVRQAVLKGKDPFQLIAEMEKIDAMEYNVFQPAPLNEKVLKDKRRKLRETLDRVLKLYQKEDPEKWEEVKRIEIEYEKRRMTMATYSEAVRHAQQVQVDDIPLPLGGTLATHIPLPDLPLPPPATASILRKRSAYSPPPTDKQPPGVPPGPPPEFSSDEETNFADDSLRSRTIRFADGDSDDSDGEGKKINEATLELQMSLAAPTGQMPIGLPPAPPPLIVGMRPPGPPPGLPPRLVPLRLPPGPPPGLPPRLLPPPRLPPGATPNVLSAAPQLIRKGSAAANPGSGPTIEGKAQIRNLAADVTRFVPTALRVKRAEGESNIIKPKSQQIIQPQENPQPKQQTKDDAYLQFMREMEGLL